jgi:hypothetical protein
MDLEISDLNEGQRQALLDLLVLAQYLDRHLGSGEDARVKRLLVAMGCETPYDRQRTWDAAVNRVRDYASTPEMARSRAMKLGGAFVTRDQCQRAVRVIEDLITCDGHVTQAEKDFLDALRDVFQL